jgi:NAD-dependent deacetylase sirtuin 4
MREETSNDTGATTAEIEALAEVLSRTNKLVALTGAGISTESGIPDYRSPNGVWSKQAPIYYADFVRNPAVRRRYWARSLNGYGRFRDAQPNRGHLALAEMERTGRLYYLVTQNVDRLHTRAGSRKVIELHGENSSVQCIECGYREPRKETQTRLEWENRHLRLPADETGDAEELQVPLCPVCGGMVKPAVVFFGESLSPDVTQKAHDVVKESDALLVVGSSLTVWSGYRLVRLAREDAKPVYILNLGPTRADNEATLKVEAPAGEALAQIGAYRQTDR